jgi:O-antigen/teichoic acid export membrane protein
MAGRFAGFVAAFAIPVVLARVFGQSDFGSYKQLFLVFATLFGIAQMGMAESLYYFLPFDARRSGLYVFNTMLVLGTLGVVSLAALWIWREPVANLLNNPVLVDYLPYVGIYLLFMLVAVVLEIVMTVRKHHATASFAYGISDLARALLYLTPLLILTDLRGLLLGAVAFAMIRFAAAIAYIHRQFSGQLRFDGPSLRKQLGYAIPFGVAGMIELLQANFHLYAVAHYFDPATFAIYAVGCLQLPVTDFLMTSTCNVMMVSMREKIIAGKLEAAISIWLDSVRKLALIFFPLMTVLIIVAQPLIVLLFTSTYQESVPIFMLWTLSMMFAALLTDGVLRVFAQTRFLILQNLLRLTLTVALIQGFIAQYNLLGAVMVTLLALVVTKIAALARIRLVMGISLGRLLPWNSLGRILFISGAAAVPAVLVQTSLSAITVPLVVLLITGIVYSLAYYLLLQWIGPMDEDEKRMLSRSLRLPFIRLGQAWR